MHQGLHTHTHTVKRAGSWDIIRASSPVTSDSDACCSCQGASDTRAELGGKKHDYSPANQDGRLRQGQRRVQRSCIFNSVSRRLSLCTTLFLFHSAEPFFFLSLMFQQDILCPNRTLSYLAFALLHTSGAPERPRCVSGLSECLRVNKPWS